jgi:AraC-like DNA-binding protein
VDDLPGHRVEEPLLDGRGLGLGDRHRPTIAPAVIAVIGVARTIVDDPRTPAPGAPTLAGAMTAVVFRARDERPARREERWRHVLAEAVGPLEPRGVPDRFVAGSLGAVAVSELVDRRPGGARRTRAHISSSDPDLCKIDVLAHGRGAVEQGGSVAALGPGDLVLVDLARPATWEMAGGGIRLVVVTFPRALLPAGPDALRALTGRRIAGDRGAGALVSALARQLPRHLDDMGGADGARLGTAVLDLLGATVAARLGAEDELPPESRRRALLIRIHAYIERHLGDPRLGPEGIAAAHHISTRWLHRLFEDEQESVAAWIRRRRLERCRRDLADPALAHVPAGAVGERWGLGGAAHFSRAFRAAYGVPPGAFRRAALGGR